MADNQAEERRCWAAVEELRVVESEGKPATIEGLAAPYGRLSEDLGGFHERIMPGAFDAALKSDADMRVDVEHDPAQLLARRSKGTADFASEADGLHVRFQVPDTTRGRDTLEDVRNGNLDGLSITWRVQGTQDQWIEDGGEVVREVVAAPLTGVTLTHRPAYRQTVDTLTLRSLEQHQREHGDNEAADEVAKLRMRLDLVQAECG